MNNDQQPRTKPAQRPKMTDILFTGGGTAGHVTPNIALFNELQKRGYELAYIGQKNSIEQSLISGLNVPYYCISAGKLRRYIDFENFTDLFKIALGLIQAFFHLLKLKPKVVFSKGGFVSSPVVWAAWLCRIPVVIHESDISPGLANKLSLPFAKKVCYSFPETEKYLPEQKRIMTGLAIRDELKQGDPEQGAALCSFKKAKKTILFIGGSQGSAAINQALRSVLPELLKHFNLIHLCGKGGVDKELSSTPDYAQFEYINEELADLFALADLVVSRAGATSIFELLSLKKPNLLIPLPLGSSRGDQILNANSFNKLGFSEVIEEKEIKENPRSLIDAINQTLKLSNSQIANMEQYPVADAKIKTISVIESLI